MHLSFWKFIVIIAACTNLGLFAAKAADDDGDDNPAPAAKEKGGKAPPDPTAPLGGDKTLPNYQVAAIPANIGITPASQPPTDTQVFGEPRNSVGHPCTLLDKDDIDALKKGLTTNDEEKKAFDTLKADADKKLGEDLGVPIAQKAPDGSWMYPGDMPGITKLPDVSENNATAMAKLGMMYQLTGDAKYADYAKKMLLAYADNYNNYGHRKGWTITRYRSSQDGRLTGQFLTDGFWLCRVALAYDLIYNLPSWTPTERAHVRDDLFRAIEVEFGDAAGPENYLNATHNRSCVCTSATLMAGYATDDDKMINDALYGWNGTKDKPTGGLLKVHFGECILPDGMWIEGAPGYQLGIASAGLFNDAETLWHHGIDMYRYRGGVLKQMLDSAIYLAYPDKQMTLPRLHDSQGGGLLADLAWLNNDFGVPFECGYRRYQDPRFLPIVRNATKTFSQTSSAGPVSLFLDLPPAANDPAPVSENVNFYSTGYGLLRIPNAGGVTQLTHEYGESAGHGHPSKLSIDLFTQGDPVMPFPGVIFPYDNPLDKAWFWTTIANSTLGVDQIAQLYSKNKFRNKSAGDPVAPQLVYGPASTMGLQRAWSNSIQPGITEDRSLFMTGDYLADIFGGFDTAPHTYDLAWHARSSLQSSLKTEPFQFPPPVMEGYNSIDNPTHAGTDQPWTATITTPGGKTVRFVAAGGTPTDVIFGTGHYMTNHKDENPAVFLQRRTGTNEALFGNVVDFSGDATGYVKSVTQEGNLGDGYGLLKVETQKGTDLCFTAFRPGSYTAGGMTTDAMQAFVRMDGAKVESLYLGGGTSLKTAAGSIERSDPGLAYVEKTDDGKYIVGNPTSSATTVTVTLPVLNGLKAVTLDDQGKPAGPATTMPDASAGSFKLTLKPQAKVEFSG
jgi:hypothetical protein